MRNITIVTPELGREKGGIQNWMYYVEKLLHNNQFNVKTYAYKDDNLINAFSSYNTDTIFLATWKMAVFVLPIVFFTKKKIFIFVHGNEILSLNRFMTHVLFYLTKRRNTYFIANSEAIAKLFLNITRRKIDFVQYPFMEISSYVNCTAKDENIFFTITRLVKRKNISNVIRAFHNLNKNGFDFLYYIAGEGPEKDSLTKLVKELQLEEKVKFLGKIDEQCKKEIYQKSSYFLLPSIFDKKHGSVEGYGIVFIEANSYCTPVLSGNTGGMIEAVHNEITGLHSDGSIDDIQNKILRLSRMEFDYKKIYDHAALHNYLQQDKFITFILDSMNE